MDDYQDIINTLKGLSRVEPPPDFTRRVMDALETRQRVSQEETKAVLPILTKQPANGFELGKSCPFWFVMAGFCYVSLGIILFIGLGRVGDDVTLARWVVMQPQIAMTVGCIFLALGILLVHGKEIVVKAAQLSVLLYIAFVVINGVGMQIKLGVPGAVMLFLFYIGCGVALGFFLQEAVHRYQQQLKHLV